MGTKTHTPESEVPRNVVNRGSVSNLSRRALTAAGIAAYEMPMEQLREVSNEQMREKNWKERFQSEYRPMIAAFANRHPELRKYADHNSSAIALELETPEGTGPMQKEGRLEPEMWDWEMAYDRAKAKGKLLLDEAIVLQQRIDEVQRRQPNPREFTEEDLYGMHIDELRRHCTPRG